MKTAYEKNMAECVINLIKNLFCVHIMPYDGAFRDDIHDSFEFENYGRGLTPYYEYLIRSRNKLSGHDVLDLDDGDALDDIVDFLNSVYNLFRFYSSQSDNRYPMADVSLIKKITQGDVRRNGDGTSSVGLGNPLILESLVVARFQVDDFESLDRGPG